MEHGAMTNPLIRWLIRRDIPSVLGIERDSVEESLRWTAEHYRLMIRQRGVIAKTIELAGDVAGVMVFRLGHTEIELYRLIVAPRARRLGLGTMLVQSLEKHLVGHRDRMVAEVHEEWLDMQLLLRSCGWRATGIDRQGWIHFELTAELFGQRVIDQIMTGDVSVIGV